MYACADPDNFHGGGGEINVFGPSLFTVNSDGGTFPYSWANGKRYELSVGSIYSVKEFRYTSPKKKPYVYTY